MNRELARERLLATLQEMERERRAAEPAPSGRRFAVAIRRGRVP